MLELQIKEMVKAKGLKSPYRHLVKTGMSYRTVQDYLTANRDSLKLEHIEILCTQLRCTPNELFAWTPNNQAEDYPENPLQALKRKASFDPFEAMKKMTPEEIRKRLE